MKDIEDINRESVKKILANKNLPEFSAGDTVKVGVDHPNFASKARGLGFSLSDAKFRVLDYNDREGRRNTINNFYSL